MNLILLATIFFIPLVNYQNFGFEQSKIISLIFFITLAGLIGLSRFNFRWSAIKKSSAFLLIMLMLTALTGINPLSSLIGKEPYFQGVLIYAYLWFFAILVAMIPIRFRFWVLVLNLSGLLVALVAIQDWVAVNLFHLQIPTYAGRVVSTFGQPNFYAGFLLLCLPFAYFLFKDIEKRYQLLGWGSGVICMVGIFVSYSQSAVLLALLLLILGLLNQLRLKLNLGLVILGVLLVGFSVGGWFSVGLIGDEAFLPFRTQNPDLTRESVEKRAYMWPLAAQVAWQRPFFGYGLENIGPAFVGYFAKNKHALFEETLKISPVLISLKELNIDRSHNYLLDLLLFSGIAGLLAWLILIGLLFGKLRRKTDGRKKSVLLVGLIAYLVWIQLQNQSIVHLIYFWLLVGLIDRQND